MADSVAMEQKVILREALHRALKELALKIDGLGEYDIRRPLTPTATNLLGLVKHVAGVTLGYFSVVFGREVGGDLAMPEDDSDMWVKESETREQILSFLAQAEAVADATIDALDLSSPGTVFWWPPDRRTVTLQQILVHVIAEVQRHAGQADILRELIDGQVGRYPGDPSIDDHTPEEWAARRARIEQAAHAAAA